VIDIGTMKPVRLISCYFADDDIPMLLWNAKAPTRRYSSTVLFCRQLLHILVPFWTVLNEGWEWREMCEGVGDARGATLLEEVFR